PRALRATVWFLALAAADAVWSVPSSADTYPRQPGVDALHYVFRLTLADDTDEVAGEATVELRFVEGGLDGFALDLASEASGKGMTVAGVASGGVPVRYEHRDDRLRVSLEPPPKAGERRAFTVTYRGVPASGLRVGANRHGERTFFSENWPDRA